MLEPVGKDAQSRRFGTGSGLLPGVPVRLHSGKLRDFSYPAAVVFFFDSYIYQVIL
jgi:hypothetical protein